MCLDCELGVQDVGACMSRTVYVCSYVHSLVDANVCVSTCVLLYTTRLVQRYVLFACVRNVTKINSNVDFIVAGK